MEHYRSVAEDEVDGSVDVTVFEKLTHRVGVERVLVAFEAAGVEGGEVGTVADCDRLVLGRAGGVLECHVDGYKPLAYNSCSIKHKRTASQTFLQYELHQ